MKKYCLFLVLFIASIPSYVCCNNYGMGKLDLCFGRLNSKLNAEGLGDLKKIRFYKFIKYLQVNGVDERIIIRIIRSLTNACCMGNTDLHYLAAIGQNTLMKLDPMFYADANEILGVNNDMYVPFFWWIEMFVTSGEVDVNQVNDQGLTASDLACDFQTKGLLRDLGGWEAAGMCNCFLVN